jgi:hypothetical protein
MADKCPRCGSNKIIPKVSLMDHYGDLGLSTRQAAVDVPGKPNAIIFRDTASGELFMDICGACGHADLFVSDAGRLWEKYEKSLER